MQISSYKLSINNINTFIDYDTNENKTFLSDKYSLAKYGSMKDIKYFSSIIAKSVIEEIDNIHSDFRIMLEIAKEKNDYIVLMTPGYRNVKSSANIMFNLALPYINTKLTLLGLPIIANMKLPRLVSPSENYASLTEKERILVGFKTDHILPDKTFYSKNNIHVVYGDDILITGSSSNKARSDVLKKGAKSFISIYAIVMDSNIVKDNPSIEEQLNKSKVTGKLDNTAKEIFIQNDFVPVLRSLRLLLHKHNLVHLYDFLHIIPLHNIFKIYTSYLTNESLKNQNYIESLEIIKKFLIDKKQIQSNGNLIL